jgi:hypothetical protein
MFWVVIWQSIEDRVARAGNKVSRPKGLMAGSDRGEYMLTAIME